ncbi:MAG TPA: permease [Micromonosporaceae bacterium]
MSAVRAFALYFFPTLFHILPWFMLAIGLALAVQKVKLDVLASRVFAHHGLLAIVLTTAIGAFSPFCSYTVIPLVRRFLKSGVALSAVMAFWVASPSMDPEIYAFSLVQLGFPISTARLVGALTLSLGAGLLVYAGERRGHFRRVLRGQAPGTSTAQPAAGRTVTTVSGDPRGVPTSTTSSVTAVLSKSAPPCAAAATPACGASDTGDDGRPWRELAVTELRKLRLVPLVREFVSDCLILGKWVVVAVAVETVIVQYVPQDAITSVLGSSLWSVPLSGLVSVPLYVNGIAAIPVVDGLLQRGMSAEAAVTFLLGGAVTTVPAMVAVRAVVVNRVFLTYLAVGLFGSIGLGLVAALFM